MQAHVTYNAQSHIYEITEGSDVLALKEVIQRNLNLPQTHQKLLYKGKQLTDDLAIPTSGKILLLASSKESIAAVREQSDRIKASAQRRAAAPKNPVRINSTRTQIDLDSQKYTFHEITPLRHLPDSDRSLKFLHRLASDGSIRRLMTRHHYSVGLLTEMDPRLYTNHDSKTLGLNKNAGAEILLRLRTDTLDGWRDYKTVRVTLIHELAHNEFGEHDRQFWDLFNLLSKEVAEYESGRRIGVDEMYIPQEAMQSDNGAAWTGGSGKLSGRQHEMGSDEASSVRERRARAAEERSKRH